MGRGSRPRAGSFLEHLRRYATLSSWGMGAAALLVAGIWGGSELDRRFGTTPWLTLGGTLLSAAGALTGLIREALRSETPRRGDGKG